MVTTVRSRFAPSPTGYLHIGGARTALFAWAYAKGKAGEFVLRIEDTDRERSTQQSIDAILQGLSWLALDYDDGPYFQMQRLKRYHEIAEQLIANGHAYKCYCSKERLEKLRETQIQNKEKPRYDGHCRDLNAATSDAAYVVRFKTPTTGEVTFHDLVHGDITVQNSELDDLVLLRSDGVPTYNFSVVVDDMDMNISIVIRGDDHVNNTPRQINIYHALKVTPPQYAHVPMILGEDGKRLSKRHGAVSVMQYYEDGFLPEALLNYLIRLGWSHGDQEIFSKEEMVQLFSLENISKSPAHFSSEKLLWLNQHYLKTLDPSCYVEAFRLQLKKFNIEAADEVKLFAVIEAQKERVKTLHEMAEQSLCFFQDQINYDEKARVKWLQSASKPVLVALHEALSQVERWEAPLIHDAIHATAEHLNLKLGKVGPPLRVAVTGNTMSPSLDVTLALLEKSQVLARIQTAIDII